MKKNFAYVAILLLMPLLMSIYCFISDEVHKFDTKLRQQNIDFTGEFWKGDDDSHDEKLFKLGGCQL